MRSDLSGGMGATRFWSDPLRCAVTPINSSILQNLNTSSLIIRKHWFSIKEVDGIE